MTWLRLLALALTCAIAADAAASTTKQGEETQLELVQIVFRHGDRTPVVIYPNDQITAANWTKYGGLGQLTQIGMQQHHAFGQYLLNRYRDLVGDKYDRNRVFVRSTDYDRTVMSAQSLLSGLYPPSGYQVWSEEIKWQPIPVHTTDADRIFSNPDKCDRYQQLKFAVIDTDEYRNLSTKYKDVIDVVRRESGYPNMTLMDMWMVCDDIFVEHSHNLPLPQWVKDHFERFMELRDVDFYLDFRTFEMAKLAAGGVLNEIKKNINQRIAKRHSQTQLVLFSSHDTYVAGITKLLNLTTAIRQPPYASAVIFELRKGVKSGNFYIQLYSKNNTADEEIKFWPVQVYGCDTLCPLTQFLDIIKDKTVEDFKSVCKRTGLYAVSGLTLMMAASFVALIGMCLSAVAVRTCLRSPVSPPSYARQQL